MSRHHPGETTPARSRPSTRRGYVLAALVLIGSLLMVWLYAQAAGEREQRLRQAAFVAQGGEIVMLLRQRLLHYELALRGGVSLYWSVARPTRRQWRDYVGGLDIERQFDGLLGLGYVPYLRRSDLEALQLAMRDDGEGLFQIRPHGAREVYGPILMLEPQTIGNRSAVGFDMFAEATRHAAMAAARDTGEVRLSAPVELIQRGRDGRRNGLLMYAPIYANGIQPANPQARRAAMSGWIYAPFHARTFIDSALAQLGAGEALRIVDVGEGGDGAAIYADADFTDDPAAAVLRHSETLDVYGRRWRVDFQSAVAGDGVAAGGYSADLRAIIVAGLVVSLLLFAVVMALAHTQSRAERLAEAMSESYRRSEQRFRNAMLYSGSGIALIDGSGRIVEANPALARIVGVAPGALAGTPLATGFVGPAAQVALTGEHAGPTTLQLRRSDGDIRLVELVHTPVPGDVGSEVAALVQVDDVTDRLRAEQEVRQLNRTLEARVEQRTRELTLANHELESFAYSVSHDLRAPLRTVEGFSRLLGERFAGSIGPDGQDYLARVRNAANRMDALIDALLKMSRITRDPLQQADVDLGRIAAEVVAELRQGDPGRTVEVRIEPDLHACGDPALLRNLLQNLLGNAWKFTGGRADARIEFGRDPQAGQTPGRIALLVRDNGAGFEPAYASKLFRPFQRLHGADEYEGHGIGLATVKRIIDRHGGTIHAEGGVGQGATFRFTLPAPGSDGHC
ncbi:CHASE domain-containing protein [Luteimonas kalidii]|uniref:histidine kinase n=1 Tax=Luteimonas kalidii TaxID=3042025 RepID=A0ABT6JSV1_9GAMM|nr:CHASE domain-containing protein [Luteimonas kalidii]MDH5833755.1 CHASE domain-containing protein [Luteimonas kalidii]